MVFYRRNRVPGGTYFFTITLRDRSSSILVDRVYDLRKVLSSVMREHPFKIAAMVVLPEHLHALWVLPPGDNNYPGRIRLMKSRFTHTMVKAGIPIQRNAKGEYDLWQRRYWEHTIRDEQDFERHVEYTHWNPVRHGYVTRVADWPHSTFHRFVTKGVYPHDWAGSQTQSGSFGE